MSEWVRRKDADWRGYVSCFSCFVVIPWKEAQCGHWIHNKLDLDEDNLKPQCARCNLYLSGHLEAYTIRLTQEHGLEWVLALQAKANQHPGYSIEELKQIEETLKIKLALL